MFCHVQHFLGQKALGYIWGVISSITYVCVCV